jgi:hypothetical protein
VKADTEPLLRCAEGIDGGADLAELAATSAASAEAGALLGARQAEALEAAAGELLCSPEIIRCARLPNLALRITCCPAHSSAQQHA